MPEVMDAIFYKEGRIRPAVAIVKSLASALAIGSGSAVGREGPIIQIGASLGSSIAELIGLQSLAAHHTRCGRRRRRHCGDI